MQLIDDIRKPFDVIIVNNEPIEAEMSALLMMSVADSNLFIVDSRLTAEKHLEKIEILKEEFTIPNIWFILNRAGYNPSLIKQAILWSRYAILRIRKIKHRIF